MGALIPVGGGADAEIKDKLNRTFSGANLAALQANFANENLFDPNHHLHRVAYRLGCYPISAGYNGENSRGKWFYFLQNTLVHAVYLGVRTSEAIRTQLLYALQGNNISRVVFEAVEITSNNPHYVYPDNKTMQITTGTPQGTSTLSILLVCPAPLGTNNTELTPDQQPDVGEQPLPF